MKTDNADVGMDYTGKKEPLLKREETKHYTEGFKSTSLMGNVSVRLLGFIAAFGTLVLCALSVLSIIAHPFDIVPRVYLALFALAAIIIEGTSCGCVANIGCFVRIRVKLEFWAKFLTRAWGKVFIYLWLAAGTLSRMKFLWVAVGLANLIVAILYLILSIYGSRKLGALRKEATAKYQERYSQIFIDADVNKDGVLDYKEMEVLTEQLGIDLTPNEIQVIVNYLDTDRDGKVNAAEFQTWFEQNKLPTLI